MKTRFSVYISLIILSLSNLSFDWPVEKGILTSTYCESRADHFHDGIDIVSPNDAIYASKPGRLIYMWDKSLFPEEHYPGGGNYKILSHNNEYSIYMHLKDGAELKKDYNEKDIIGYIGNSGHSFAKHLHFSLLQRDTRSSQNPLAVMPQYHDTRPPAIDGICLNIDGNYFHINNKSKFRLTRHYPLLIKIIDSVTGKEKLGIYSLKVIINNTEALDINFDTLDYAEKGLSVNGLVFDDVFDDGGYYKVKNVDYRHGTNNVYIFARDYAGNESVKQYTFDVKLDIAQ